MSWTLILNVDRKIILNKRVASTFRADESNRVGCFVTQVNSHVERNVFRHRWLVVLEKEILKYESIFDIF